MWFDYIISRLFCGNGYHGINVSSVKVTKTASDLSKLMAPIAVLDSILSDNISYDNKIRSNESDTLILKSLFKTDIGNAYIYNTFRSVLNNKQQIKVNLQKLDKYCNNKQLLDLIFHEIMPDREYDGGSRATNDNLIKSEILNLFPNVSFLGFICTDYPIHLLSLLSIINATDLKIKRIEIIDKSYDADNSWLSKLASSSLFTNIITEYAKAGFKLTLDRDDVTSLHITAV